MVIKILPLSHPPDVNIFPFLKMVFKNQHKSLNYKTFLTLHTVDFAQ